MRKYLLTLAAILAVCLFVAVLGGCVSAEKTQAGNNHLHSIVRLHDMETGRFFCSAVVISPTLAITAAHCLNGRPTDEPTIMVQATKDSTINVKATVAGYEGRSDQGLITGDFRIFRSRAVETRPDVLERIYMNPNAKIIACGFPYAGDLVCTRVLSIHHIFFQFGGLGFLYPGMSGGPVIDLDSGKVIGSNTAVDSSQIIVSPTADIFDNLQVKPDIQ